MDGFDDLLAPSRQALEDNPFADPFAKRSGSPDPWASPFANTQSADDYGQSATPILDTYSTTSETYKSTSSPTADSTTPTPSDPLESTIHAAEDEDQQRHTSLSTGFRESVEPTVGTTDPDTLLEEPYSSPGAEIPRASTPSSPTSSQGLHVKQPSRTGTRAFSPSPSTSNASTEFVSPLEQRSTPIGVNHSIAGLSLGGESLGWQSERGAWDDQAEDSDDDKPISQTVKLHEHGDNRRNPTAFARDENGIQPVFVITVDDPQKVGDPIRSFTMYTVHTRTTSPLFQKSAFSVLRRYSDFLWLYETLSINNPGVVVPPVPEKNPFGRFDDQFVRQRRFALEKCIQKIANHPVLGKDSDLRMFLESDSFALDIKHRKAEIAHERGGLMASIGQTITGPRFHETDEWFDRQRAYLDSLESQLRGLVKAIDTVARHRAELAVASGEFAQTVSDLSSSDVGKQLSSSLVGLAEVEQKAQEIQTTQAEQDMVTLMSTVDEYTRLINSVRLAFSSRVRTYHAWRTAESDLLRTKQTHEKNRSQGRIPTERLGHSLSHIAEAERRALDAKHEYDHVSKLVKTEVARFEQERIQDFKDSLHAFLEGMISRQQELIAAWENYQQMLLKRVGGGGSIQIMHTGTSSSL